MEPTVSHTDSADPSTLLAEMRQTQKATGALVRVIAASALPEEQRATLLADLTTFQEAKLPSARALYRATLAGGIPDDTIFILWNRAKRAFMASAPSVIDLFLAKMENETLPYSERLLVEAMKGMGILVPSSPVDAKQRDAALAPAQIRTMTDEELRRQLQEGLSGPPVDGVFEEPQS